MNLNRIGVENTVIGTENKTIDLSEFTMFFQ